MVGIGLLSVSASYAGVYPWFYALDLWEMDCWGRSATPILSSQHFSHYVLLIRWVGGTRAWTGDLSVRSPELYRLSYTRAQGERMTDSKARMRDLSDCEFCVLCSEISFHQSRWVWYWCVTLLLLMSATCTVHLPFFLKSNPSFSLFPVLCGSRRAPHTLFLTVLNVFSLLCAACLSRKINRLINMRA